MLVTIPSCNLPVRQRCSSGEQPMMLAQLFFGRNVGNRHGVSDAQFDAFVDQVLTRHFPAGLTRMNASGHWRADPGEPLARERSEVVTLVVADSPRTHQDLERIRQAYMARFRQESVLLTHLPVCARL